MSRSGSTLTASLRIDESVLGLRAWGVLLGAALLLAGVISPWVVTTGAGTTMNMMDLAEWMTLHPGVRAESPALFSALGLRSVLLCVSIAWALLSYPRWVRIAGVFLLAVALLPPVEFVSNPGDSNYQQLLLLAVLTLVSGVAALLLPQRWRSSPLIRLLIGSAAFLSTGYGLARGLGLMQSFAIDASLGAGALLVGLGVVALVGFGRPAHPYPGTKKRNTPLRGIPFS